MGCASSTPMVATAGSEMLKAATHVADDAKQKGEAAVQDATQAIGATIDTAKETVSTAVAGITSELGNAFKDGTEAVDEAKHKVLEGLHLETKAEPVAAASTMSSSRAPTPALDADADADSLKTSTPEPEIERALANSAANEEEAPPTPKPSLQEMAELSAQVGAAALPSAATEATVTLTETETTATTTTTVTATTTTVPAAETAANVDEVQEDELPRPSTTEWEKLADQLAKSRKFKPYESFAHTQNQFSVYKDYTSMRDKPNHYDGHFSDGKSLSSTSVSDLSSGHLTPAPTHRGHRDYAKFVGSEQPASVSRTSSRLSNVGGASVANGGRAFDFNPQRDRISLPIATSRTGSRVGSAAHGRRSLWGRGQPDVLHEEPPMYSPVTVRRSSMTTGLGMGMAGLRAVRADERSLPAARSISNLSTSPMPIRVDAKKNGHKPVQSTTDTSRTISNLSTSPLPSKQNVQKARQSTAEEPKKLLPGARRTSEPYKNVQHLRSEGTSNTLTIKSFREGTSPRYKEKDSSSSKKEAKSEPTSQKERDSLMTSQLSSKPNRFITPAESPTAILNAVHSPRAFQRNSDSLMSTQRSSKTTTPLKTTSDHLVQTRIHTESDPTLTPKRKSRSASRASTRLSSGSSAEIVIKPLSHLNTPSVVSLSPADQVVLTEYEDVDLEAALARLADWRGSTTTLHSTHSNSSRLGRSSHNATKIGSRHTSPWVRHHIEHSKVAPSCGIAEYSTPTESIEEHKQLQLDRCEICCSEIVMK
ncbi:hypothetical protein KR222_009382 [Zaprionus bogoriensis]|nr:hypothetical protein KR222_009382 [Zaprionus bogoriensis]